MNRFQVHGPSALGGAIAVALVTGLSSMVPQMQGGILNELRQHTSVVYLSDAQGGLVKTIRFSGVNLQVVNGLGATNGHPLDPVTNDASLTSINGLGNLIVGYNEPGNELGDFRTGSHNVVVGSLNSYASYGGLVASQENKIAGPYATCTGGTVNKVTGVHATIGGGRQNKSKGLATTICGGFRNLAKGDQAAVSGGHANKASGARSSILGGSFSNTSGVESTVSGGEKHVATGFRSTIAGGAYNASSGSHGTVTGGVLNDADTTFSTVGGGYDRVVSELSTSLDPRYDWVAGSLWEDE